MNWYKQLKLSQEVDYTSVGHQRWFANQTGHGEFVNQECREWLWAWIDNRLVSEEIKGASGIEHSQQWPEIQPDTAWDKMFRGRAEKCGDKPARVSLLTTSGFKPPGVLFRSLERRFGDDADILSTRNF